MSQAALAEKLGMSQPIVARVERGGHTPHWESLGRLARAMGVHVLVDVDPVAGPDSAR